MRAASVAWFGHIWVECNYSSIIWWVFTINYCLTFSIKRGDKNNSSCCEKGNLTKLKCYLVKSCTGVIRVILKIWIQMILPGQASNSAVPLLCSGEIILSINWRLVTSFRPALKEAGHGHGQGHGSFISYLAKTKKLQAKLHIVVRIAAKINNERGI